jgi:hypothetical protein
VIIHLSASGTELPGAMADFNRKIVELATLNFREVLVHSEYVTPSQLDHLKYGLGYAGYRSISAWKNLGFTFSALFLTTKLVFVISNILLFFVKTKNRCGKLRLRRQCVTMLENISTLSYFNFEMSSSIMQLTGAFVYLRVSETYFGYKVSATRILHYDMFVSITSLSSMLYLIIHLTATAHNKGWWGLRERLVERRGWYARRHRSLMNYPMKVKNKELLDIRVKLTDLDMEFNK